MSAVLEVRDLRKTYTQHLVGGRRLPVLRGVDLAVAAGEVVVVRGQSGSGKSTLLRCVYRSALADAGSILLGGPGPRLDLVTASEREVLSARRERMALARPRPLLLLDEVTAALDPARRAIVLAELLARKRAGATVLAVFHDVPEVPGLVDRVLAMRDGELAA